MFWSGRAHYWKSRGLTLIELLVSVAVLAVLVSIAAPSFTSFIDRTRLTSAVDALNSDLQLARSEALRTNQSMSVNFQTGASGCYGIVIGSSACDCSITNSATAGYCGYKLVRAASSTAFTISASTFAAGNTSFDPARGFSTAAGAVTLQSNQGKQAQVNLSLMGTTSVCNPTSGGLATVYPSC